MKTPQNFNIGDLIAYIPNNAHNEDLSYGSYDTMGFIEDITWKFPEKRYKIQWFDESIGQSYHESWMQDHVVNLTPLISGSWYN